MILLLALMAALAPVGTAHADEPLAPPTITGITPDRVSTGGGGTIWLTGTDLAGTTSVAVDGVPATGLKCASDTSCAAVAPPHAAGSAAVTATNSAGTSAPSAASTVLYGVPTLKIVGATQRSGPRSAAYPHRLKCIVGIGGVPVAGAQVMFGIASGGATFNGSRSATVKTGPRGIAYSPFLDAGRRAGRGIAFATTPGAARAVTWQLRAT